jgi:hypothetical protein
MTDACQESSVPRDQNEVEGNWVHVAFFIAERLLGSEVFFFMREEHCKLLPVKSGEVTLTQLTDLEKTWFMIPEAATKLAQDYYRRAFPDAEIDRIRRCSESLRSLFWCILHRNHPKLPEGGLKIREGFKVVRKVR